MAWRSDGEREKFWCWWRVVNEGPSEGDAEVRILVWAAELVELHGKRAWDFGQVVNWDAHRPEQSLSMQRLCVLIVRIVEAESKDPVPRRQAFQVCEMMPYRMVVVPFHRS